MRDEIQRIAKMVEDGKLTADQAADLIDAITSGERRDAEEQRTHEQQRAGTATGTRKDTIDSLFEAFDRTTRDAMERVNWPEISEKIRSAASTGWGKLRTDLEQIGRGDWKMVFGRHTANKHQELPLSLVAGNTLRVELTNGDLTVRGGASEQKVVAEAEVRGRDEAETEKRIAAWSMIVEESGGEAVLKLPGPSVGTVRCNLDISLPEGVILDVKSVNGYVDMKGTKAAVKLQMTNGDVTIADVTDRLQIQTTSGDISLSDFTGNQLTVESRSGDISVKNAKGNINIRTASGDLKMEEIDGATVSLETISGDIDALFDGPVNGKCNLRSVNGDIKAQIPDGGNCRVSLSSLSGDVANELHLDDEIKSERRITGQCGDGTGTFDVSAISGDVHLEMKCLN